MEYWPVKIRWEIFQQSYKTEPDSGWTVSMHKCNACDAGSMNGALSDVMPQLVPHLPVDVTNSLLPLTHSIAICGIGDQEMVTDNPKDWNDVCHEWLGAVFSPDTVKRIVGAYESVSTERLLAELEIAWPNLSDQASAYKLSEPNYFENARELLDYFHGWYEAFAEAAKEDMGLGIGGG